MLSPSSKLKIFNSFIQSNFNYCPVVYNTFAKQNIRLLEKLHERALRFVLNDFSSTYSDVLINTRKPSLALSRLRTIAEQVYKVKHDLAPPFSSSFFQKHETLYDLRRSDILHLPKYNTVKYGKHSFQYMGAFIWNALPNDIKLASTILDFKTKIKHWQGPECNCRNCLWCDVKLWIFILEYRMKLSSYFIVLPIGFNWFNLNECPLLNILFFFFTFWWCRIKAFQA